MEARRLNERWSGLGGLPDLGFVQLEFSFSFVPNDSNVYMYETNVKPNVSTSSVIFSICPT